MTRKVELTPEQALALLSAASLRREDLGGGEDAIIERTLWRASNAIKRAFGWAEEPE